MANVGFALYSVLSQDRTRAECCVIGQRTDIHITTGVTNTRPESGIQMGCVYVPEKIPIK